VTRAQRALQYAQYARYGNLATALHNRTQKGRGPRRLLARPMPVAKTGHSATRINALLDAGPGPGRYLEIGLARGATFEYVRAGARQGVDPAPRFDANHPPKGASVYVGTSDEFFALCPDEDTYDVVYLDGLHTFRQTYRDLINALRLCQRGVVLIDDVIPCDAASALPDRSAATELHGRLGLTRKPTRWHGDVYKVVLCVAKHHPELTYRTIVGSDKDQALVWREVRGVHVQPVGEDVLDAIESIDFITVFGDGLPDSFRPVAEPLALAEAIKGTWNSSND
jgi:Methyltransferase domain